MEQRSIINISLKLSIRRAKKRQGRATPVSRRYHFFPDFAAGESLALDESLGLEAEVEADDAEEAEEAEEEEEEEGEEVGLACLTSLLSFVEDLDFVSEEVSLSM